MSCGTIVSQFAAYSKCDNHTPIFMSLDKFLFTMRRILKTVPTVHQIGVARFSNFSPFLSGSRDSFRPRSGVYRNKKDNMDLFMEEIAANTKPRRQQAFGAIKKNIYEENEKTKTRSQQAVKELRENGKILVGANAPNPIKHFNELQFSDMVIKELSSQYQMPTPIQSQSWPIILSGKDLIGISETGSGKTLGFILPMLAHIQKQGISLSQTLTGRMVAAPIGIIVAPVRELARQISEVSKEYEDLFGLRSALFYGGSGKDTQFKHFNSGFHFCIGTPGRLLDFAHQGHLDLERISICVIDEADTMLSMGFYKQIHNLIHRTRPDRQTLLWTATWPSDVRELARDVTTSAIKIDIGSEDLRTKANITQEIIVTGNRLEYSVLADLFERILEGENCKTLLFTNTKARADRLTFIMQKNDLKVDCIHGDKSQSSREGSLDRFRKGYVDFLVATDVASRGLDIKGIQNIVNVDFPQNIVSYIHRIGRTARGQKKGKAYSIFTPNDAELGKELIKLLKETNQEINPDLVKLLRRGRTDNRSL